VGCDHDPVPLADPSDRPAWGLVAGIACAAFVVTASCGSDDQVSAADEAEARITGAPEPSRYDFAYGSSGTEVLDCIVGNRQFTGTADLTAGVMLVETPAVEGTAVIVTEDQAFLSRDLFATDAVPEEWLMVEADSPADGLTAVLAVLGTDLGAYARPGGFVASGNATASAALDTAASVSALDPATIPGTETDGFRITLDPDELDGDAEDAVVPVVDFWIDGNDLVRRIEVHPAEPAGATGATGATGEEGTPGWRIDYTASADRLDPTLPTADAVSLADVDPGTLDPPPTTPCELPAG
jgi:hypothetical protein